MSTKVRIVYKPDGSVAVVHPASKSRRPDETEDQWLKRVFDNAMRPKYNIFGQQVNPLHGMPHDDMDVSELPTREDRDAWEGMKGKGIWVNEEKARKIRKERETRRLIEEEKRRLLEEQAIARLKEKGLL